MQKKRIMISALALVVVALVASWGVNAYFNDTEGTPANSVKAGTLDLVLTPGGTSTLPFVATPVYPGEQHLDHTCAERWNHQRCLELVRG